jgi:hypothetical protein
MVAYLETAKHENKSWNVSNGMELGKLPSLHGACRSMSGVSMSINDQECYLTVINDCL